MQYLVYLAGPISGLNYSGATEWREYVKNIIDIRILTLSPMRAKDFLKDIDKFSDYGYEHHPLSTAKGINTRDYFDVQRADAVFVNFLEAKKVSIGTVMEIAWARAFNKPVVCCMEEDNPHRHAMLEYACGFILPTLEEGIDTLQALLLPDKKIVNI
jgi:nucleoside 2-deoxyribosyltransferase